MSKRIEEGRTAKTDMILIVTATHRDSDEVGDEANHNVAKLLRDLSGRSVEDAYLHLNAVVFETNRRK